MIRRYCIVVSGLPGLPVGGAVVFLAGQAFNENDALASALGAVTASWSIEAKSLGRARPRCLYTSNS